LKTKKKKRKQLEGSRLRGLRTQKEKGEVKRLKDVLLDLSGRGGTQV